MKKTFFTFTAVLLIATVYFELNAQKTIASSGVTTPPTSNYPRMSHSAIEAIQNPSRGDVVYDLTFSCHRVYTGRRWKPTYQAQTTKRLVEALFAMQHQKPRSKSWLFQRY
ncbi:hypothetical protein [Emticicia soli]|uniref:Uncharacterized protein n=1 Tax=Emticicia soli TaxID=2027878 RepID=A0ABW5JCU2_9BACT